MALDIVQRASPNFGPRRDGLHPHLIVLHYTAMENAEAALERLCDPDAEVSAHYLIAGDGTVYQMVPEDQRAWHAGAGEWAGQEDINSRSIGIELDNRGDHPFSEPLMRSLEALLRQIMARSSIAAEGIIGHSDMAPGRKGDPGPHFDWARLARQGLAAAAGDDTGPDDPDPDSFRHLAVAAGYTADVDDETLLTAVRLRFRPFASGPLCAADLTALPRQG
ncbi:N-acetylmuramoyl-L-alanine amidase [Sulfitobacter sp. JB4-11]|uniref:N-acetylmuramoyl-L-alanine amidase n=1 Tax=Sulfitobacter rhodophyticola TaxID=3238304 RepID=UPI0035140914